MNLPPVTLADLLIPTRVKRRCFISYHHRDEVEVRAFIQQFSGSSGVFTHRALGIEMEPAIINSMDTDYVMRRIRENYLGDTSVTIVMIGRQTWSRRYVDWEIKASLRNAYGAPANGLLGVKLKSFIEGVDRFPQRLNDNLLPAGVLAPTDCYARHIPYPVNSKALIDAIEAAHDRRFKTSHLIKNNAPRMLYNKSTL